MLKPTKSGPVVREFPVYDRDDVSDVGALQDCRATQGLESGGLLDMVVIVSWLIKRKAE